MRSTNHQLQAQYQVMENKANVLGDQMHPMESNQYIQQPASQQLGMTMKNEVLVKVVQSSSEEATTFKQVVLSPQEKVDDWIKNWYDNFIMVWMHKFQKKCADSLLFSVQ